jgi:hypothetical protein
MSERPLLDALAELAREQRDQEKRTDLKNDELFRPVSPEKMRELNQKVREQLDADKKVIRLSQRSWPWFTAIAASILVVAIGGKLYLDSSRAELPRYSLSISSGALEQRSAESKDIPTFEPDTTLQIILRPANEVSTPVELRAFLVRDKQKIAWAPPTQVADGGSILIEGRSGEFLKVEPGPWTILFVLEPRAGDTSQIVLEQKIIVAE